MLIPLDRKPDWHNPPLMTLLLIMLNVLVFYGLQASDDRNERIATEYYFNSELPAIELGYYLPSIGESPPQDQEDKNLLIWKMQLDGVFQVALRNNQVIKPGDPNYLNWKPLRDEYQSLLDEIIAYRFSLKTAEPSLLTGLTHMFLHADSGHLIGNMLFLLLFGFVIELTMGKMLYLASYLFTGVMSAIFYVALTPDSYMWGLGASGAISGLAGMYTVLFGLRRIRFFYTLLFYFDYIKAPAIIMLPVWLGYEFYDQYMYPDSGINNQAHIGGLLAGALIAFLAKKYTSLIDTDYLDEEEKQNAFRQQYQQGLDCVARLDFINARKIFHEIEEQHPDNLDVNLQLFNLYKQDIDNQLFHDYANRILSPSRILSLPEKQLFDVYSEYVTRAQRTQLRAEQLVSLAIRFANGTHIEEAEKIILFMTQKKPDFQRNAEGLLTLVNRFWKMQNNRKSELYYAVLEQTYPQSSELQLAQKFIRH